MVLIVQNDIYIKFEPSNFQQVANELYYRCKEKLFYRFISSQLVFAYDSHKTLSLNSCNILIPTISGINIKFVMAILNSRVAQFLYKNVFNSVKVLRKHIESIPIPNISIEKQNDYIKIVDKLLKTYDKLTICKLYAELDNKIRMLYSLNDNEYNILKLSVDGENKFLY